MLSIFTEHGSVCPQIVLKLALSPGSVQSAMVILSILEQFLMHALKNYKYFQNHASIIWQDPINCETKLQESKFAPYGRK